MEAFSFSSSSSGSVISENYTSVDGIIEELQRHLSAKGQHSSISTQFSTSKTNAERVDFAYRLLDEYDLLPVLVKDRNNNELALDIRKLGNDMFREKKYDEAIEFYSQSILLAENGSEYLALAYANRSAVLFETGFYKECLMNIARAFENNYPDNLKPKVLTRQQKANNLMANQKPFIYFQPIPEIPESHRNKSIPCASDCVEIKHTKNKGRGVFATRDISVGEVLAVEEPFCTILTEQDYNHCHNCLKVCYNLIPCTNCTHVMFCNEECKEKADNYHKYECKILETTKELEIDAFKLLPLKMALLLKDRYPTMEKINEKNDTQFRSDRYDEVHTLNPNTCKRPFTDLFERACYTAILYCLIKNSTDFFQNEEEHIIFKELVLLHMQIAPCNSQEICELAENDGNIYEPHEIGAGIYTFMSLFNHRCSANVEKHCHGSVGVVRCLENIKKGEQCFQNYGFDYGSMPKWERQAKLKKQYSFNYDCEVCINDWPLEADLPVIKFDVHINYFNILRLYRVIQS